MARQAITRMLIILLAMSIFLAFSPSVHSADICLGDCPPIFSSIPDQAVIEGSPLTFTLHATDPDSTIIIYGSIEALPEGSTLDSGTGVFSWTPDYYQAGVYTINFTASDGSHTNYEEVNITVVELPPPDVCSVSVLEATDPLPSEESACCYIDTPGTHYYSDCLLNLAICNEKYGLLIVTSDVLFEGEGKSIIPTQGNCCAGIKVNNVSEGSAEILTNVTIKNVIVEDWHTGILFDAVDYGEISGSEVRDTQNGIYLSDARNNNVSYNIIENNSVSGIKLSNLGRGTGYNTIYNNYLKNLVNTSAGNLPFNAWNISATPGSRIITSGNLIGGNYWGRPGGGGYSDTCLCNLNGFCYSPFVVENSENTDYLPLCQREEYYIDILVTGDVNEWTLPIGTSTNTTGIDLRVQTDAPGWKVSVKDKMDKAKPSGSEGRMVQYNLTIDNYPSNPKILTNQVKVNGTGYEFVTLGGSPSPLITKTESGTFTYDIGIQQTTIWGDIRLMPPDLYRIVVEFDGMITV